MAGFTPETCRGVDALGRGRKAHESDHDPLDREVPELMKPRRITIDVCLATTTTRAVNPGGRLNSGRCATAPRSALVNNHAKKGGQQWHYVNSFPGTMAPAMRLRNAPRETIRFLRCIAR
jgi:hypothetical protein